MTTLTFTLPDSLSAFIEDEVASKGFESGADYLRALIREQQGRQALRDMILEGAAAPVTGPADDAYFDGLRTKARLAG